MSILKRKIVFLICNIVLIFGLSFEINGARIVEAQVGATWTQTTAAAPWATRGGHTSVVFNNAMWIIGGGGYNDVWKSNDGINWTQVTAAASWAGRSWHTSVVFNNEMWVIGGSSTTGYVNDVWHSPDGIAWTQATAAAPWAPRIWYSSVVFDNKMWVIGGLNGQGGIFVYLNDAWSSSDGVNWTQEVVTALWAERASHSSVVFNNEMWVIGGFSNLGGNLDDVWHSADGINWWWSTSMPGWQPRLKHSSVVFNNEMWVIGGLGNLISFNDVWHSPDGIAWTQATAAAPWQGRDWFSSVVFKNKMWVMGGEDETLGVAFNDVWYSGSPPVCNSIDCSIAINNAPCQCGTLTTIAADNGKYCCAGNSQVYNTPALCRIGSCAGPSIILPSPSTISGLNECCTLDHNLSTIDPLCTSNTLIAAGGCDTGNADTTKCWCDADYDGDNDAGTTLPGVVVKDWKICCIVDTIYNVTDWVFYVFLVGVVLTVIIAGFFFLTAGGDPGKIKKAQSSLLYGAIALMLAISAKIIPAIIKAVVS